MLKLYIHLELDQNKTVCNKIHVYVFPYQKFEGCDVYNIRLPMVQSMTERDCTWPAWVGEVDKWMNESTFLLFLLYFLNDEI